MEVRQARCENPSIVVECSLSVRFPQLRNPLPDETAQALRTMSLLKDKQRGLEPVPPPTRAPAPRPLSWFQGREWTYICATPRASIRSTTLPVGGLARVCSLLVYDNSSLFCKHEVILRASFLQLAFFIFREYFPTWLCAIFFQQLPSVLFSEVLYWYSWSFLGECLGCFLGFLLFLAVLQCI